MIFTSLMRLDRLNLEHVAALVENILFFPAATRYVGISACLAEYEAFLFIKIKATLFCMTADACFFHNLLGIASVWFFG